VKWYAQTISAVLGKGSIIHFTEMTTPGVGPSTIKTSDEFNLGYPGGTTSGGKILAATTDTLTLEIKDKTTWTLTPHTSNDQPVSIESPGLHSQNWVVR
jgi:hypothetical protein